MLEVPDLASGNPQLQKAMNKLVQAEDRPLKKIDERKAAEDNKLKLVRELKDKITQARDAVSPFKKPEDFRELIGVSSHPDVLSVGAVDKALARPGSYDIEVVQLATSNSVSTYGFPDKDRASVGVGYVGFETPDGENHSVYINSDNNTLEGVAGAINSASLGVRAMVVNDGSDADEPWRLVITGDKTGWKNDKIWPEFNLLDGDYDLDIDRTREAQSAIVKLNGEPLMVDENSVKSLLPGVTFDLKKAQAGQQIKLEIKPDYEKIEGKAKDMVDKLNAVFTFIQNQNKLNADSRKDPTKALGGDVILSGIESRLRDVVQRNMNGLSEGRVQQLRDMGILFNRNGTLEYDSKKFQSALEAHFDEVSSFFGGDGVLGGFATQIASIMDGMVRRGDGQITLKEEGVQNSIKRLDTDKESATKRAEARIERAKVQFGKAEGAIQQMQQMQANGGVAAMIQRGG